MPTIPGSDARREVLAVTGAAGWVGRHITPLLREHFRLRLIDVQLLEPVDDDTIVQCDLSDAAEADRALSGTTSVLHLAAKAADGDFVGEVVPKNIIIMYNVLEAVRKAEVGSFVFMSSGQVVLGNSPEELVSPEAPPRPIGPYAASKVFGEALSRHYHDRYGMRAFMLRLGWFGPEYTDEMRADPIGWCWTSPRDLADLILACLRSDETWGVYFAASAGAAAHWDLSSAKDRLGWVPQDAP